MTFVIYAQLSINALHKEYRKIIDRELHIEARTIDVSFLKVEP